MIRLLIVDDISSTRDNLQKLLSFEDDIEVAGTASDGREGLEAAHRLQPDIVLTDVNMPVMDGIQLTETLASELPTSPVIIMSVQGERDYLRRAMQAGAREFLIKPFSHDELVAAIRRVYQLEQKKGTFLAKTAPAQPEVAPAPRTTGPAEVILVFSGKGGVGKTLVATNLAVALAEQAGGRVALVDLDLQFGDVGVMLNLDHSRSITELVDGSSGIDDESVGEVLASGPAGIKVLLAPISPELADLVTAEHVRAVITELRRKFDYVIVDSASHLTEFNLEVIELAQRVLVITALTIPAIKDAKLTLKVLESLSVDPEVDDAGGQPRRRLRGLQPGIDRAEPAQPRRRADTARPARHRRRGHPRSALRHGAPGGRGQSRGPRAGGQDRAGACHGRCRRSGEWRPQASQGPLRPIGAKGELRSPLGHSPFVSSAQATSRRRS